MTTIKDRNLGDRSRPLSAVPMDARVVLWSFCVLFGLIAASLSGYSYGLSDHAIQLPLIFRLIDPGYLTNDFFVNSASGFGPVFFYSHVLAFSGKYMPLDGAMAVLWLFAYIAVILVTAFTAKDVTGSVLGGMIAAILITLSTPFSLGSAATVFEPLLIPRFLAMPFGLFAIWKGIRDQPIVAATASIPAILVQPAIGLETAGLALAATAAHRLFHWRTRRDFTVRQLRNLGIGVLIVGLTTLLWIVPTIATRASFSLATDDLVRIYAHFRIPHHLVPSSWDVGQWALGAGFAIALAIALVEMFRTDKSSGPTRREQLGMGFAITSIFVVIAGALVGGYIFVEIIPTRLAVMAQTFRMVAVAAWLGWIVMAGLIAKLLIAKAWRWAVLFVVSAVSAPTLLIYVGITSVVSRLNGGAIMKSTVFFAGTALLVFDTMAFTHVLTGQPTTRDLILIASGLSVVLVIAMGNRLTAAALVALGGALVTVSTSLALERYDILPKNIPGVSSYLSYTQPILTLDEAVDHAWRDRPHTVDLATVARENTGPDAVFLIPWGWDWQYWRLFTERAVVVDFKSFPFQDEGMEEWYGRYLDIYDQGAGYPYDVTESELLELQRRYGFHYAMLPVGAGVSFPVLASSGDWKLVQVAESVP